MGVKCGIYCIENRLNHKKYIGQSIDISRRWMQHKQQNMIARDTFLYNAIKKYGIESFDFYILEECNEEILNEREMFWIEYYDTFQNGYNMTIGGAGTNTGERHHLQNILPKNFTKNICNEVTDVVPIAQLDLNLNILNIYKSVQDCARENKVAATNISKTTRQIHKTCKGYIYLRYEEIKDMTKEDIQNYIKEMRSVLNYSDSHSVKPQKVALVDENGIIKAIYNSINSAGKLLKIDPSSITKVCKGRLKATNGLIFRYI